MFFFNLISCKYAQLDAFININVDIIYNEAKFRFNLKMTEVRHFLVGGTGGMNL